ncbi:hypothetical protein [Nocardia cyriacigeorgica]|uniref:hypothetical protein n=1 Tax=Nocardia cyriacigeorgica TaxID=135487 RepID=UPI0018930D39|nr:hypothetical protein [Nocardia cyriacigeorgica]MBF6325880.1 hypothetical protein [Nocardia cyriacigeorgica]
MPSRRLLIIMFTSIVAVVVAVFALTITRPGTPASTVPDPAADPATPTERSFPDPAPNQPPTTDLFGARLEVPPAKEGVALPQDPSSRPDPARPDYLTAVPARLQWQRGWGGAALPASSSDGPARIVGGIASGFSHTPQGAALAALDALARALAAPDGIWQQVVAQRYYGGGQALIDRFALARARTSDAARYVVVPAGIRIHDGYRSDFAVIEVASRSVDGYAITTWPMVWIDDDWRVRVPEDIEMLWAAGETASTLTGFGHWASQP